MNEINDKKVKEDVYKRQEIDCDVPRIEILESGVS